MRTSVLVLAVMAGAGLLAGPASLQERLVVGDSPYNVVDGWMKPFAEAGFAWGSHSGVFAESPDRIFVTQRGEFRLPDPLPSGFAGFVGSIGLSALRPEEGQRVWRNSIFAVDGDGNLIESWTQWDSLFEGTNGPHKIRISPYDPARRVWVVSETNHVIYAFSNDGSELLMTLGEEGVGGDDETHFGRPQDIAFLEDGTMFVADGLDNSRIVKLDAEGNYVTHWGVRGDGRGQFDGVHAVATDVRGNIYVADRNNDRVQVFNQTTRSVWYHPNISPIGTWPDFDFPNDIYVSGYDVWVADNMPPKMVKLDVNGNRLFTFSLEGEGPGTFRELHQFSVDSHGTWYGADNVRGRTQRFDRMEGASFIEVMPGPDPPLQ